MARGVVVLAAGQGTRMRSRIPKVLHELAGRPLLHWVLDTALAVAEPGKVVVVVGHGRERVEPEARARGCRVVVQEPQRGTGDALAVGLAALPADADPVLVLSGDVPLLEPATLEALAAELEGAAAAVLTARLDDPGPYGRVVRAPGGGVARIVEARDASPEELAIREVNAGVYAFRRRGLAALLGALTPDNAQGEYYLTDVVALAVARGERVVAVRLADPDQMLGVNTRADLARAARLVNRRVLERAMARGVTVLDPETTWVEPGCVLGPDVVLEPGVLVRGGARIGNGARIGAHTVVDGVEVPPGAEVPPLSHLRRR